MSSSVLQDYHTKAHSSGIDLSDDALAAALVALASSTSRVNYVSCTYSDDNSQKLVLHSRGEDGFVGLLASLADDAVVYGTFLARSGKQLKRVFCHWVGEGVKPLERARVSMHLNDVMRGFEPVCSFDIPSGESTEALCEAAASEITFQDFRTAITTAREALATCTIVISKFHGPLKRTLCLARNGSGNPPHAGCGV